MATKEPISKFVLHDRHGHDIDFSSFSVVSDVSVTFHPGVGEPYGESRYQGGILYLDFYNIKGEGITGITYDESQEDGGTNYIHVTTDGGNEYTFPVKNGSRGNGITSIDTVESQEDDDYNIVRIHCTDDESEEGTEFRIKNGKRGNGIASVTKEESDQDGGTNTVTIHYTDENMPDTVLNVKNGRRGDTVILGNEDEYILYSGTGSNTDGAMTQAAISDIIAEGEDVEEEPVEGDFSQNQALRLEGTHAVSEGDKIRVTVTSSSGHTGGDLAVIYKDSVSGANKIGDVSIHNGDVTITMLTSAAKILVVIGSSQVTEAGRARMTLTYLGTQGTLTRRVKSIEDSVESIGDDMETLGQEVSDVKDEVEEALKVEDDIVDTVQDEISPEHGLRYDGQIALKAGDIFYVLAQTNVNVAYGNLATVYRDSVSGGDNTLGTVSLKSSTPNKFVLPADAESIIVVIRGSWVTGTGPALISVTYPGKKGTVIKELENIKEAIGDTSGFGYLPCPTIYARTNVYNDGRQHYTNKVYPEGFVASPNDEMTIDGGVSMPVIRAWDYINGTSPIPADKRNAEDLTINLKKGLASERVFIPVKAVKADAMVGKKALVLCLGESTTAAVVPNPYTQQVEASHGWPSAMQHFANCDNIDVDGGIYVKTLGTQKKSSGNYTSTYKGETLIENACREGHGGWRMFDFLHYPAMFDTKTDTDNAALWSLLGLITKTPYNAASYNSERAEYTGSEEQQRLMRVTSFGIYKVDGSAAAWNKIKSLAGSDGFPAFSGIGDYTGSPEQIAAMQGWVDTLCNSPINPFYSLDKVRDSDDHIAFSLDAYLSRYRTLDDEGNRLDGSAGQTVTGQDGKTYTIGTEVTNTSAWDVCTPTHVIINIGINDSVSGYQDLYIQFVKELVSQFSVPTAYFVCRKPCACIPAMWAEKVFVKKMNADSFSFFHAVLGELTEWFEEQPDKYMLPVYHIQPPCSVLWNFVEPRLDGEGTILNASISNVHPGYDAYRAIGWQCLNWLYYIID